MAISIRCTASRRSLLGGLFLVPLLAIWSACGAIGQEPGPAPAAQPRHLIILHTNDIHGQILPLPATWIRDQNPPPLVGGVERIARYIDLVRKQAALDGDDVLVVDAGDWFQGTPEGALEKGLPLVRILSKVGYDVLCVGNHEFDHGVGQLLEHLQAVSMPALLANVREPNGQTLGGTLPYKIVERAGSRIALVGLLTTQTPSITHPSASTLTWNSEAETLTRLRGELRKDCDWVLPITHMGVEADEALAQAVPDLPLIIGGHSHTLLPHGRHQGDTLIVQAGSKGRGVGRIDVTLDGATGKPMAMQAQVVNLFEDTVAGGEAPEVAALCAEVQKETEASMAVVVGSIARDMPRSKALWQTSPLGNWVTDVMLAKAGGDIAIQNRGGLRADWKAGPITRRDVFSILPFDNSLVTLTMPGAELEAFLRRCVESDSPRMLEFSGAEITVQADGDGWKMVEVLIEGQPLDPARSYHFVTNNYLAGGGDGLDELALIPERVDDGRLQRDLMEEELLEKGQVEAWQGNRYHVRRP